MTSTAAAAPTKRRPTAVSGCVHGREVPWIPRDSAYRPAPRGAINAATANTSPNVMMIMR